MAKTKPHCRSCRFYFITYDVERPHGCHAFGFKSKRLPCREVFESTGEDCAGYEARPKRRNAPGERRA